MAEHRTGYISCCFVFSLVLFLSFRPSYGVLYSTADHTVLLENDTISSVIHNSQTAWVVEFYSSFCGHCHAFAPVWKNLARMTKDWRQLVHVAAIDCAEERNLATCVHYKIEGYPSVKFFNASAPTSNLGETFRDEKTLLNLLHETVKTAELQKTLGLVRTDVDFIPIARNEFVTSFLEGRTSYDELALIFEVPTSYIGREVMLDMIKCPRLAVRRVLNQNRHLVKEYSIKKFPSIIVVHRRGTFRELSHDEKTHAGFKRALEEFCVGARPPRELPEVTEAMTFYKKLHGKEDKRKQEAGSSSEVYMQDLESGLYYMLKLEIGNKALIEGKAYSALRNFLVMLSKCFPGRPSLGQVFNHLLAKFTKTRTHLFRSEYMHTLDKAQDVKLEGGSVVHPLPQKAKWAGCAGSEEHYRGYPCSLWTLFHTLTVNCGSRHELTGLNVLTHIREFIRHFFSCEECSEHFTAMSANITHEVSTQNQAILWLWRGHNKVNKRLAGDKSEDPKHPKIQFPSKDLCQECRYSDGPNGEIKWNEGVVLEFLKNHYGVDNIRIKRPAARSAPELEDADLEFADYFVRQLKTQKYKKEDKQNDDTQSHTDKTETHYDPYAEII